MKDDWTILYCDTVEDMEALVFDKTFVWPLIMRGVRDMMNSDRTSIIILEGKLIGGKSTKGDATVWITMSDSDVESSLEKGLKWRESREEYEECGQIVDLLEDWRSRRCLVES